MENLGSCGRVSSSHPGALCHDSEFATTFHHEPLLQYRLDNLPFCSSDDVFFAPNPSEWYSLLEKEREENSLTAQSRPFASGTTTPTSIICNSHMYKYDSLSDIVASIQETRNQSLDHVLVDSFRNMLLTWHSEHSKHGQGSKNNYLSLMRFWYLAFMALYADFDFLERSIGRDGRVVAEQARRETNDWAVSSEARYGLAVAGIWSDWIVMRATKKNGGTWKPEMRLPALIPFIICSMIGMVVSIAVDHEVARLISD